MLKTSDAIKSFGNVAELASALGISVQAVYQWGDVVPKLRQYEINEILSRRSSEPSSPEQKAA